MQSVRPGKRHHRLGTASVRVYDSLSQRILSGELPAGTRLVHRTVAQEMGTSNGPVITALLRLEQDGLITYQKSMGGVVREFSEAQSADWMNLRRALETEAARLAARRSSPDDLDHLSKLVDHMGDIVTRQAWSEADQADVDLHVAIARLTRSSSLMEALERCHMRDLVRRRLFASTRQRDLKDLETNHRKLVEAIATHDPDLAGAAMHAHLSRGAATRVDPDQTPA